jgi:AcrR family transcriptional regulator
VSDARRSTVRSRPRSARGEGERLAEELLQVAVELLEAEGDEARLSVRGIAKAAGVSPTALYLHYPDRDALVSAAVDRSFRAFNDAVLAAAEPADDPRARIRAMAVAYLHFTEQQPALYAVIFSTRRSTRQVESPDSAGPTAVDRDAALNRVVQEISASRPEADPGWAPETALMLWSALHGFAGLRGRPSRRPWPDAGPYIDRVIQAYLG